MRRNDLLKKARRIRVIVADVDGVLTDGGVFYGHRGEEIKRFHIRDGLAVKLARSAGIRVILVSGRSSPALRRRGRELGVDRIWEGVADKRPVFDIISEKYGCSPDELCCIGDDLPDLSLLSRAGLAVTVPGAPEELQRKAAYVTKRRGGEGALREVVELILKAQGRWKDAAGAYSE